MEKARALDPLKKILSQLPRRQKRDLWALLAIMVGGAIAELVSISSLFVFLAALADVEAKESRLLRFVSHLIGSSDTRDIIIATTMAFALTIIVSTAFRVFLIWRTSMFTLALGRELNSELFRQIVNKPYLFHTQANSGQALSLIEKSQSVADLIMAPIIQAVAAGIVALFILITLMAINPVLVGAVLGIVVLSYVAISLSVRQRLEANSKIIARKELQRIIGIQESFGGIRDIILRGIQQFYVDKYRGTEQSLRRSKAVNNFIAVMPRILIEAIGILVIAGAAYVVSQSPGGIAAALPTLGALALGAQRLMPQAQIVYSGWALLVGNQAALREVADAFSPNSKTLADEAFEAAAAASPILFDRELRLEGVRFQYETRPRPALDGVTLSIAKGERLGIVGKTGSGKSTLVDILMGLVSLNEGALSVDGRVLTEIDLVNWRRRIAHVPQAIYFNDASVASNIAFGVDDADIDLDRVREAARRARIADFIDSLDKGYDTVVGERGVQLSGGQRQRIAIARAFYFTNADIFVFDEATSALDAATERDVISALDDIDETVTVIMIAHRVMTLERCDRVVHLADGRITHIGPPSGLDAAAANA